MSKKTNSGSAAVVARSAERPKVDSGTSKSHPPRAHITSDALYAMQTSARIIFGSFAVNLILILGMVIDTDPAEVTSWLSWRNLIWTSIYVWIAIMLYQGNSSWKWRGVMVGVYEIINLGLSAVTTPVNLIDLAAAIGFGGALILALSGESNGKRTRLALGIYTFVCLAPRVAVISLSFSIGLFALLPLGYFLIKLTTGSQPNAMKNPRQQRS